MKFPKTTISDLIDMLEQAKKNYGDIPVAVHSIGGWRSNRISMWMEPNYYDGGYIFSISDLTSPYHHTEWMRSKTEVDPEWGGFLRIDADAPEEGFRLSDGTVAKGDLLDGIECLISEEQVNDPNYKPEN
jgi:hypothetical protein